MKCAVKKHTFLMLFVFVGLLFTCEKQNIVDPFWSLNINSDLPAIRSKLIEESKKGEIVDCVFSFDKVFYVKEGDLDARIKTSLDYPKIVDGDLKINYNLVPEFKGDYDQEFNHNFFKYFENEMISIYGQEFSKVEHNYTIELTWETSSKIKAKASVITNINLYMVSIRKKD